MYNIFHEVQTVLGSGPKEYCHVCQMHWWNAVTLRTWKAVCLQQNNMKALQVSQSVSVFRRDAIVITADKCLGTHRQACSCELELRATFVKWPVVPRSWQEQRTLSQLGCIFRWWEGTVCKLTSILSRRFRRNGSQCTGRRSCSRFLNSINYSSGCSLKYIYR